MSIPTTKLIRVHSASALGITAAALIACAASTARAQTFTALGVLSGGSFSVIHGVSATGSVCAGAGDNASGQYRAFRRASSAGLVDLGVPPGGTDSFAYAVSGGGTVVVGDSLLPDGFDVLAFRWVSNGAGGGTMSSLGMLPDGLSSSAQAVNDDGTVVVGYDTDASVTDRAFRWTSAGMVALTNFSGATSSVAFGVSANGLVVTGYCNTANGPRAFRWTGNAAGVGTMVNLQNPPGGGDSLARAISADGAVVVGDSDTGTGTITAFIWNSATAMTRLGTLPGSTIASASAVNADGTVVVGVDSDTVGDRAFIWSASTGTLDLNTYLPSLGIDLSGWFLTSATSVSADGLTIAGDGSHNGRDEAWIATIPPFTQPCPVCVADFNQDGGVTGDDVQAFFTVWATGEPCGDANQDGGVDGTDVATFFIMWEAGQC